MANPRSTFYVYDNSVVRDLGGAQIVEVKDNDGKVMNRTIELTDSQASYWLRQGVIGVKPYNELSEEARTIHHQLTGGGAPAPDRPKDQEPQPKAPETEVVHDHEFRDDTKEAGVDHAG